MAPVDLPENAGLEQLRSRARALARAVRAGEPAALELIGRYGLDAGTDRFPLARAQFAVARSCGFASWPRLKRYFEVIAEHRWDVPTGPDPDAEPPALAACRLACLTYTPDDGPHRWARAREILTRHPGLTRTDLHLAAAAADVEAVRAALAADPAGAARRGGPYGWRPLCQLAYSRLDQQVPVDDVLAVARLLLDAGADPDEGYFWRGLPSPFTLLTGVLGHGEQGPARQPPHPAAQPLARLLLAAGADPNDAQALYNRMFSPDDSHLHLLLEFGLGRGDGGVWRRRLGEVAAGPAELLRHQLGWAIDHGMADRVRLLLEHGVDPAQPFEDGSVPVRRARVNGQDRIARLLVAAGAPQPPQDPVADLIGAVLAGDRRAARQVAADPQVLERARRERPGVVVWAAANRLTRAVELLADLGFDLDALGRGDSPVEQPWESALHHAAWNGDLVTARLLLDRGARTDLRDARFGATPLGWAQHAGQADLVRLLAPLTPS